MEDFETETRYLKLCYVFRAFIRYMKAAFYRPDYEKILNESVDQKTRPSICFKTWGQVFETLSRAFETLDQAFEGLREN